MVAGKLRAALELCRSELQAAETGGLSATAAYACSSLGIAEFHLGLFADSRDHCSRAMTMYDHSWSADALSATGFDFLSVTEAAYSMALWVQGELSSSEKLMSRAISRAKEIREPFTLAHVLNHAAIVHFYGNNPHALREAADALGEVVEAHSIGSYQSQSKMWKGLAHGLIHDPKAGIEEIQAALARLNQTGTHLYDVLANLMLAQLKAASAASDDAIALIGIGLDDWREGGLALGSPLQRLRGEICSEYDTISAEAAYRESIRIARTQGARTFELQAALPLARLLRSTNRPLDARALLTPALEGFAPTPELQAIAEAQALLEMLRP
jgi:hypothetical protein